MTRRALWIEAFCCSLLVVLFYHPLLRIGSMQSGGDAANLFWPIKFLIAESFWRDGVVPLWNPYSFMGTPLMASLQHAVFYPIDWILYAVLPPHMGIGLGNLLHLGSAGVGTFFWLRVGLYIQRIPAVAIGAAFPCCAWFWGHQEHINQIAATSYLPWLAFATWMLLSRRLSVLGFTSAYSGTAFLQFMAGHPQEAFYAHLFCGMLVIGKVLVDPDRFAILRKCAAGFILAGIIAGFLVCVQLLPTMELQKHSRRQFRDPLYAISFSMPPDLLITYFSPHHFGSFKDGYFLSDEAGNRILDDSGYPLWDQRAYNEYGLYIGIPALVLAIMAVVLARRKLTLGLLLPGVVALLLALGGNTDPSRIIAFSFEETPQPGNSLYELFMRILPPTRGFRVPARIAILAAFSLMSLAAIGADFVVRRNRREGLNVGIHIGIGILVFASLYIPSRREKFHDPIDMSAAVEILRMTRNESRTLDARHYRLAGGDDEVLLAERQLEGMTAAGGAPIYNRLLALQPHMNVPVQWPSVDGYEEGLVPTARLKDFLYDFNRNFRQFRPDPALLTLLGVRYVYTDLPIDTEFYPVSREHSFPGRVIVENPLAGGAAFWKSRAAGVDLSRLDGPFWRGGNPHPEIQREEVAFGSLEAWNSNTTPLRTVILNVNRIDIRADVQPQQDAILAMGWYPGWVFTGSRTPLEFVSAVHADLPVAESSVSGWEVAFRPFSYHLGLFLSALGIFLWFGVHRFRKMDHGA